MRWQVSCRNERGNSKHNNLFNYLFSYESWCVWLHFYDEERKYFYENINDLSGLSKNHPMLALSFLIILFSLAGIPPLAGFFAKFYVFMAVIEVKMYALAIIGLVTTVVSAFYYLRIIKVIYFDKPKKPFEESYDWGLKISLFYLAY